MKSTTHLILGMLALTFGVEAKAQIQLPWVFSDGMVLQQNSKVAVWGWGNPSETLMILSGWNPGDTVRTVVDNQGRWKAEVPTGRAGGPYTLEVKGGNDSRKVSDVMLAVQRTIEHGMVGQYGNDERRAGGETGRLPVCAYLS